MRRQVQAASDEAVRSGGQVSAEQIEALARLARLVELQGAAAPPPGRRRWPLAAALAGTLLIVSALFFARVRETEVELDVAVSEVSFALPSPQVLIEGTALTALGVSGLRGIQLPDAPGREALALVAPEGAESAIRMTAGAENRPGTIDLGTIMAPARTRVWLRRAEAPGQYRLSLQSADLDLHVDVHGSVRLGLPGAAARQVVFVSPKAVLLQPGPGVIDLDLTFRDLSRTSLSPQMSVSALSFSQVEQLGDTEHSVVRRLSTVLSGTLYLESLDGAARPLRPGEDIRFGQARGQLRAVRLGDDHISLRFHGRVRDMTTGSEDSPRSLMPTWLEWLKARHGLSLLWGTTLYVSGLIVGALRWLRMPT